MNVTAIVNDDEIKALLAHAGRRIANLRPVMQEIGQRYERRVLQNFEKQQAPDGTPWQPTKVLSNYLSYVGTAKGGKRKSAYTQGGSMRTAFQRYLANKRILVLTGRLRSRIHYQADATSARIGVAGIEYAAIHQFGGMAGRGHKVKIPARPYLAMNSGGKLVAAPRDRQMVIDVVEKHLKLAAATG